MLWLRPIDLLSKSNWERRGWWREFSTSILGAVFWGGLTGLTCWAQTGDGSLLWVVPLSIIGAITVAGAFADPNANTGITTSTDFSINRSKDRGKGSILTFSIVVATVTAIAYVLTVIIAVTVANTGAIVGLIAVTVASAGIGAIAFTQPSINNSTSLVIFVIAIMSGLTIGDWLPTTKVGLLALVSSIVVLFMFIVAIRTNRSRKVSVFFILLLLIMPVSGFILFPHIKEWQVAPWGMAMVAGLAIGLQVGFFQPYSNNSPWKIAELEDLSGSGWGAVAWLSIVWLIPLLLAIAIWTIGTNHVWLEFRINRLTLYLVLLPPVLTGLPLYPVVALITLWQFRASRADTHTLESFTLTAPFRWQSFAYPMPRLKSYLVSLGWKQEPTVALQAIQLIQTRSLQGLVARSAVQQLLMDPETALPFLGQVAVGTNPRTLVSLALLGPLTRKLDPSDKQAAVKTSLWSQSSLPSVGRIFWAITILSQWTDKEEQQPLMVYGASLLSAPNNEEALQVWINSTKQIRHQRIQMRVNYAWSIMKLIDGTEKRSYKTQQFEAILAALNSHILIHSLPDPTNSPIFRQKGRPPEPENWLLGGWHLLERIELVLQDLVSYRELLHPSQRRELLWSISRRLDVLNWLDLADYWANIGSELAHHWQAVLRNESLQAREWLHLELDFITPRIPTGNAILQLRIDNPTGVTAHNLVLRMEESSGLTWGHPEARLRLLGGGEKAMINLTVESSESGEYRVTGTLTAEDLEGHPLNVPFASRLLIAEAGRPYHTPNFPPYILGPGLDCDQTFAGRSSIMNWLAGLWQQSGSKAAVVLVGLRRIGKTSLLYKLRRDGLPGTSLLPIYINIQGTQGEFDFLNDCANKMARSLEQAAPILDPTQPYPSFKAALAEMQSTLGKRRFLLMLDEADLIPQRHLGDLLPGFLRALMQEPDYPTVLLFCGTHALKRMGRDYDSILFNTAQTRTVGYLDEAESAEVLKKPVAGVLEFDPAALAEAYRQTHGQPLLLQSLGQTILDRFDVELAQGKDRSDYVDLGDLQRAARGLAEQDDNMAFDSQWASSDHPTHRVMSALAWATTNRDQLDIRGIEQGMAETRLELPREQTFTILERLADEEILTRAGPTYRYTVPLQRQWIAWRWPPDRVAEEQ